jgi:hypothetical protein
MRSILRFAGSIAVIGGLLTIVLVPAMPASAATQVPMPSDCHALLIGGLTPTLNCTDRPANQTWQYATACFIKAGQYIWKYGTEVTGDGTSTITDCAGGSDNAFYIDS